MLYINSYFITLLACFWNVNQVLDSTTFLVRCGHVLSAILKNICIYFVNRHISLGAFV